MFAIDPPSAAPPANCADLQKPDLVKSTKLRTGSSQENGTKRYYFLFMMCKFCTALHKSRFVIFYLQFAISVSGYPYIHATFPNFCYRERPIITVLNARPMNEVGFRDVQSIRSRESNQQTTDSLPSGMSMVSKLGFKKILIVTELTKLRKTVLLVQVFDYI